LRSSQAADLEAYLAWAQKEYGQELSMTELLASMITTFVGDDKDFQRHLAQQRKAKPDAEPEPAGQ